MGPQERIDYLQAHSPNYKTPSLDYPGFLELVETLEDLEQTTTFDLDVATDIHPEMLDQGDLIGGEYGIFWKELYKGLESNQRFIILPRESYSRDRNNLNATINMRIFEDLTQDQILFLKGTKNDSKVIIQAPHQLVQVRYDGHKWIAVETHEDEVVVFDQKEMAEWVRRENYDITPEVIANPSNINSGDNLYQTVSQNDTFGRHGNPKITATVLKWAAEYVGNMRSDEA